MQYAPVSPEEKLDDRFVEACQMLDSIEHLADLLIVGDLEQRVKAVEALMRDGSIKELEKRLKRLEKEGKRHAGEQELE